MKVIWIVLFAFVIAFLDQGNSLPSRTPKGTINSPVFPSKPVQNRAQDVTDGYIGTNSYASGMQSSRDRILDSGEASFLAKRRTLSNNGKHLSKKVARLLRSSTLTSSNDELQDDSRHVSQLSPSDAELGVAEYPDIKAGSSTHMEPASDTDWASGISQDLNPDSEPQNSNSESNTYWNFNEPEDIKTVSDTDLGSGAHQDMILKSDTDLGPGATQNTKVKSVTDLGSVALQDMELRPDIDWRTWGLEDVELKADTDSVPGASQDIETEPDRGWSSSLDSELEGDEILSSEANLDSTVDGEESAGLHPADDRLAAGNGNGVRHRRSEPNLSNEPYALPGYDAVWGSYDPKDISAESDTDLSFGEPQDVETESDTDLSYVEPSDIEHESDTDLGSGALQYTELSPDINLRTWGLEDVELESDTDSDSGVPQGTETESDRGWSSSLDSEIERDEIVSSDAIWDSTVNDEKSAGLHLGDDRAAPVNLNDVRQRRSDPNSSPEPYALPSSDTDWVPFDPKDMRTESNTDWDYGEPQDENAESDTDLGSGVFQDIETEPDLSWSSGLDSELDGAEILSSEANLDSSVDGEGSSGLHPADDKLATGNDNGVKHRRSESNLSPKPYAFPGSNIAWGSYDPKDVSAESDTHLGYGESQDENAESDTDLGSGALQDMEFESDTDLVSGASQGMELGSDTDLGTVARQDMEHRPDIDLGTWGPEDVELESDTDSVSGVSQGTETESDRGWSSGLDSELQGDEILSSEANLDSSVDAEESAGLHPVDDKLAAGNGNGVRHRRSEYNLSPEPYALPGSDTGWGSYDPKDISAESVTDLGFGEPQDVETESDTDLSYAEPSDIEHESDTDLESGAHQGMEFESDTDSGSVTLQDMELSPDIDLSTWGLEDVELESDTDSGSGVPQGTETESDRGWSSGLDSELERDEKASTKANWGPTGSVNYKESAGSHLRDGRAAPPNLNDVRHRRSNSNFSPEPYAMPVSDIRWTGISLAQRRRDDEAASAKKGRDKKKTRTEGGLSAAFLIFVVMAGVFLLLMMISFFVFAWPIRKYYAGMCRRVSNGDVETGQYGDDELSSIRIEGGSPSECDYTTLELFYNPPYQQEPSPTPPQTPVEHVVTATNAVMVAEAPRAAKANTASKQKKKGKRTTSDIVADDKRRDSRNAERRKIIKRQTSERRDSLVDSLMIAKFLIDGYGKNRDYEKKASERRRVIRSCQSAPVSETGTRRVRFADEIQAASAVIAPEWDYKESLEKSREKCRAIKDQFYGKRRPSLLEEIEAAKHIIVDCERRKYELPPAVAEEMLIAHMAPGGPMKYYSELLDKLIKENSEMPDKLRALREELSKEAEEERYLENELLWLGESF